MKEIAVVGFGRFGELFAGLAADEYRVSVCDNTVQNQEKAQRLGHNLITLSGIRTADIVVFAVPISSFEGVVQEAAPFIGREQIVADVCSVKVHPAQQMRKHLGHARTIATHPMFGPDSTARGLTDLQVALCPLEADEQACKEMSDFWTKRGVQVIDTTPDDHDRDAAYNQGMPYTIAHALNRMNLPELTFTTRSSTALYDIAHYSARDSEQLFQDMLAYNPYVPDMLAKLNTSMGSVLAQAGAIAGTSVSRNDDVA